MSNLEKDTSFSGIEIAVIGMDGRFPGADDIHRFWENLKNGTESVGFFSEEELKNAGVSSETLKDKNFVGAKGGVLPGKEFFDARFFGYSAPEANTMSPQTRIFHECVWHALEDAGYTISKTDKIIGLYAGASHDYFYELAALSREKGVDQFAASLLTDRDFFCSRISYNLDLKGPSQLIQTACSTSLVAIDQACRGLLTGTCDMAVAGGIAVRSKPDPGYIYQDGMIFSSDGHCRAFDADASGSVGGEGVGVVVLKRLEDALADNDHVYAVIRGFAVNNDGKNKIGYTAPGITGQAGVIQAALNLVEIPSSSVTYVETHGTATPLGDVTEIEALKLAFNTDKKQFCAIGSVKTNVGHLGEAAGAAGFIKAVLALKHRQLPPSINFTKPNPRLDLANSPFYVNTALKEWRNETYPLRAGVSSFGIGGTNAHMVLEEAPEQEAPGESRSSQLLLLSARTQTALDQMSRNLAEYMELHSDTTLADIAYTLQTGRKEFAFRQKVICSSREEAVSALLEENSRKKQSHKVKGEQQQLVFMFPGLGAQYVNMCKELYTKERLFREELDKCFALIKRYAAADVKQLLFPAGETIADVHEITNAQYLVFSIEYSLAKYLIAMGIKPAYMIGYSFGEYVAACISNVFSLEDAVKIIAKRGELLSSLPPGCMLSVPLERKELVQLLRDQQMDNSLAVAIDNGPSCVVSGTEEGVQRLESELQNKRLMSVRLPSTRGIHSFLVNDVMKAMEDCMRSIRLNPPAIPYLSNVTGEWIKAEEATDPAYWAKHLRQTVEFARGLENLFKAGRGIYIEIGPGGDLSVLVNRMLESRQADERAVNLVPAAGSPANDSRYLVNKLGQLWMYGAEIDWKNYYADERRQRVSLPGYPFERQRYWKIVDEYNEGKYTLHTGRPENNSRALSEWFYKQVWKRNGLVAEKKQQTITAQTIIVFEDDTEIGKNIISALRDENNTIISVVQGEAYAKISATHYCINLSRAEDYDRLLEEIKKNGDSPDRIIHLFGIGTGRDGFHDATVQQVQDAGYYSILNLAQSLAKTGAAGLQLDVISDGVMDVTGEEPINPSKATVLGPVMVIPQELTAVSCRFIDVVVPGNKSARKKLAQQVLNLLADKTAPAVSALRGKYRWVSAYEHAPVLPAAVSRLENDGVYVISGGLGGIALALVDFISKQVNAKLILIGRSAFPPREEWESWLAAHDGNDVTSRKIGLLKQVENRGTKVRVLCADIADEKALTDALKPVEKEFGAVNGVIHTATLPDGAMIIRRSREMSESLFRSKVYGTLTLDRVLEKSKPGFVIYFSSLNALYGGIGQAGYCAANAFLDALANYRNRQENSYVVSINWDRWKDTGIAKIAEQMHRELSHDELRGGLDPEHGLDCFSRVLNGDCAPQVAVSVDDLGKIIEEQSHMRLEIFGQLGAPEEDSKNERRHERPDLSTEYSAPENALEQKLVTVWENFFGISQVGTTDNFFELGGDSLKGMVMLNKYKTLFNQVIPIAVFFNSPTVKASAQYLAALAPGDIAVSEQQDFTTEVIPFSPHRPYYRLSPGQKRLYILQELEQETISYNTPVLVRLGNKMDRRRLEDVFTALIARHESLRTCFKLVDNEPVQQVQQSVDFSMSDHTCAAAALDELLQSFTRPFRLEEAPLLRAGYVRVPGDEDYLLLDMHHIITDGISQEVLKHELWRLYQGESLPPLRLQYKDYSEWINAASQQQQIRRQESFWKEQFSGELPVLNLPLDYVRPQVRSFEGSTVHFELSGAEYEQLQRINREYGLTTYMSLLTLVNIWLSRLSGQQDIIIGSPIAARRHPDLEQIIGMFVNTLALRNYPSGDKLFSSFAQEVKQRTFAAYENQEYAFEDLVDQLSLERDPARNPLFDVMLALQNQAEKSESEGLIGFREKKDLEHIKRYTKFDLTIDAIEKSNSLSVSIDYSSRLFQPGTIDRFIGFFRQLLQSVSFAPDQRLRDLDILGRAEQAYLLEELNHTQAAFPSGKTIHALFAEQVARTPEATALVCGSTRLSYRELDEQSSRLSSLLMDKGVGPDVIVGLLLERSAEMVIGILGVLKAGGAYLPIDPTYPASRISYMLNNSKARLLLVNNDAAAAATTADTASIETLNIASQELYAEHAPRCNTSVGPHHLAYVIYTSGSTGMPKGAMIEHRSLVNRLWWKQQTYPIGSGDCILQKTPYTFDVSVWELLLWSFTGARVLMLPPGAEKDPEQIVAAISSEQVTMLHFVPSMLKAFLRYVEEHDSVPALSSLKRVICSGEALGVPEADRFYELLTRAHGTSLVNLYGPTEATIDVSYYNCVASEPRMHVPIGKPIANTGLLVLNEYGQLQGIGLAGELYITGVGLGRGYLDNAALTAERFVTHAYVPGERMYKTGDLARWLSDGNIEYLGRMDDQVKVRGYRIELGEIETALRKYPSVQEAIVTDVGAGADKMLVAYFVSAEETGADELRVYLSGKLPAYMVPVHFIRIDKIPLSANGKADKKQLPRPDAVRKADYIAPGNEIEKELVRIWSELLGVAERRISTDTSFFELGGNSLKLISMAGLIRSRLGKDVKIISLFEYPTIVMLARYLQEVQAPDPVISTQADANDQLDGLMDFMDIINQ